MASMPKGDLRQSVRRAKAKVRHAAMTHMPMLLSGGKLRQSKSVQHIQPIERDIALPDLPDALDGLRITHLTDLHIGSIVTPDRLPKIVEMTNAFEGDLIAVTGDFVDLSLNVLEPVVEAMKQLRAPMGVYFVPGNHDYLDDGPRLIAAFKAAGLRVLMNESDVIEKDSCRVVVSGIDYPHRKADTRSFVRDALKQAPRYATGDVRLLLAHHPRTFDVATKRRIDLTMSGHTHGGQVVFSNKRGKKGSIGLGSLAHRYPRGLYQRGQQYLYVNSGVGTFFPLRVKCPAEIACLTLKSQAIEFHNELSNAVSHP